MRGKRFVSLYFEGDNLSENFSHCPHYEHPREVHELLEAFVVKKASALTGKIRAEASLNAK